MLSQTKNILEVAKMIQNETKVRLNKIYTQKSNQAKLLGKIRQA